MTRSSNLRSTKNGSNDTAEARSEVSSVGDADLGSFGIDAKQLTGMSKESQQVIQVILCGFQCVIEKKNKEIMDLKDRVSLLESRVEELKDVVDSNSNYERRDTLVVTGDIPKWREQEKCSDIVRVLLRDQLRINLNQEDISTAHRIGRKPGYQEADRRGIVFKLCRRDIKRDIMTACREMKPPFYINESLTPIRSTILFVLRKARSKFPQKIGSCKSFDGNVTAFIPDSINIGSDRPRYRRVVVNTKSALDDFLNKQVSCTSEEFVQNWPK